MKRERRNLMTVLSIVMVLFMMAPSLYANLITNGDFSASWTGWVRGGYTTIYSGTGTFNEGDRPTSGYIYQDFNTVIGQEYHLEFEGFAHGGGAPLMSPLMGVRVSVGSTQFDVTDATSAWTPILRE